MKNRNSAMAQPALAAPRPGARPLGAGLGLSLALLALSGCGTENELQPPPGRSLPVAPYGAGERADADTLLTPSPQAAPERSVELRRRSEEREDDPFDVPPQ